MLKNKSNLTVKGLLFYPIYKLTNYADIFMNAGWRYTIIGSESKRYITHSTARSMSITCALLPLAAQVPQEWIKKAHVNPEHAVNLYHSWGIPSLRTQISSKSAWHLSQRMETLLLSCWTVKKTKRKKEMETYPFKKV